MRPADAAWFPLERPGKLLLNVPQCIYKWVPRPLSVFLEIVVTPVRTFQNAGERCDARLIVPDRDLSRSFELATPARRRMQHAEALATSTKLSFAINASTC